MALSARAMHSIVGIVVGLAVGACASSTPPQTGRSEADPTRRPLSPAEAARSSDRCLHTFVPDLGAVYEFSVAASEGFTTEETVTVVGVFEAADGTTVEWELVGGADFDGELRETDTCRADGRLSSAASVRSFGNSRDDVPRAELPGPDEPEGVEFESSAVVLTEFGDTIVNVSTSVSTEVVTVPAGTFDVRTVRVVQRFDLPIEYVATQEFSIAEIGLVRATFTDVQGIDVTELVSFTPGGG